VVKQPSPKLSQGLETAINALGANPARLALLAALHGDAEKTASELLEETGLPRATLKGHLAKLVEAGWVIADPPKTVPFSERRGHPARYSMDKARVAGELGVVWKALDLPYPQ